MLVGAGLAAGDRVFRPAAFALALAGALAIQVAANFANDASDAKRGADNESRLGPPRMVALGVISARRMWVAAWAAVAAAGLAAVGLALIAGPLILLIGAVSVVAMLGYVGGPIPYGYRGLGEVFVFIFFGLVATVGARYVHDSAAPLDAWLLATGVGASATAILAVNNYRDIDTDREAGKRSLAVILGRERARVLCVALIWGAYPLIALFALAGWSPRPTLAAALLAPLAAAPAHAVRAETDGAALTHALKQTARLHLWVGAVLAAGSALRF